MEAVHGYQPSRTSQVFYGTVIHQVLDRAHAHFNGLIDPSTRGSLPDDADITRYFNEVRQSLRTRGVRGARVAVEDQALDLLKLFNTLEGPTLYPRVVDTEHRMQADERTYVLHGTADVLVAPDDTDRGPETLEIWDYKGQRRPSSEDPQLADYLFQMRVYAELYRRRNGAYPARGRLYFLNELYVELREGRSEDEARANALLTVEITPADIAIAMDEFRRTVGDIEANRRLDSWLPPEVGQGPGEETCTICDFRWNCPTVRGDSRLGPKLPLRYP